MGLFFDVRKKIYSCSPSLIREGVRGLPSYQRGGTSTLRTVPVAVSPSNIATQRPFGDQLIVTMPLAGPAASRNALPVGSE